MSSLPGFESESSLWLFPKSSCEVLEGNGGDDLGLRV